MDVIELVDSFRRVRTPNQTESTVITPYAAIRVTRV